MGGSGGTGGTTGVQGPCDDAGLCPSGDYCEPSITQCAGQDGVGVEFMDQPGSCYSDFPCPSDDGEGPEDCTGTSCGGDNDCGLSISDTGVGLTCQSGVCALPSTSSGGSGGTPVSVCPSVPVPCPAGCRNLTPVHGCAVCLCPACPVVDAGIGAGSDGG